MWLFDNAPRRTIVTPWKVVSVQRNDSLWPDTSACAMQFGKTDLRGVKVVGLLRMAQSARMMLFNTAFSDAAAQVAPTRRPLF
jgi:hypothetical protein